MMAPLELDGENLGKKHQQYNKLLKEAVQNPDIKFTKNFKDDGDINILLQIDVACINRNVEFLLEVLKSEDMLYVSRAVKRSTWLITDPNYAHIITIDYLTTHMFPYMLTAAINKLMLSIRLHIKDEKRAESFFNYEKTKNLDVALKWLPYCSLPFIEQAVAKYKTSLSKNILKRLCERSFSVLEVYLKDKNNVNVYSTIKGTFFLIKNNAEKYLEIVENLRFYEIPSFGPKYTEVIMKVCPQKILDRFEKYANRIDYATCAKYMKKEDIKDFLLKQAANENMKFFLQYSHVKHFLKYMPKEGRFEFIKQMFINNEKSDSLGSEVPEFDYCRVGLKSSCSRVPRQKNMYDWYIFAPFDIACRELKKQIRAESSPDERNIILTVLLHCAGNNVNNIHTLLEYYYEKHINEPFKFKLKFIERVLKKVHIVKHDTIWPIINRLFHSMEVYVESTSNVQSCIEFIIIYNAIHDIPNPQIIMEKNTLNTLKQYRKKLRLDEREKVFQYLYNLILDELNKTPITSNESFDKVATTLKTLLNLINDWEKNLKDYPEALAKIKELISIKQDNSWNVNLTCLYNINKSWRKYMFEESIVLWPSESVCINALKHDPTLLSRYNSVVEKLCCDDNESLRILFNKIRVYWPLSLTTEWTNLYLQKLDNPSKHKGVIKALMIILPQDQLVDIIRKYAPNDSKINWGAVDEPQLSLLKCIAKKMYVSRPLLPVELVLLYAKGDYLQYAVPSLSSILSNISSRKSGPIVQQLLMAPVSLQKYGIRLALAKLEPKELKPIFSQAWKSTTNATIRSVLFENTHHALCDKTNIAIVEELWALLSDFIDNLSHKENKKIYTLLGEVKKVPVDVRGKYYMKSCTFLKSMPTDDSIESILNQLMKITPYIMDQLDTEFIANVILNDMDNTFVKSRYNLLEIISTNALFCNDEITQTQRYDMILSPLLDRYLPMWNEKHDNKKYVRYNIENLLKSLVKHLKDVFLDRDRIIPVKMFTDIQNKLENSLVMMDSYTFVTNWKLVTAFTELVNTNRHLLPYVDVDKSEDIELLTSYERSELAREKTSELFTTIMPFFAKVCTNNLQKDVNKYFPSIYLLYGQAVYDVLQNFEEYYQHFLLFKHMLTVDKSTENYLLVNNYCSIYAPEENKAHLDEIRSLMQAHPSVEVQMHCRDKFNAFDTMDIN